MNRRLSILLLVCMIVACKGKEKADEKQPSSSSSTSKRSPPPKSKTSAPPPPVLYSPPPPAQLPTFPPLCQTYKVQPGDTPSTVAKNAKVDYEDLILALQECIAYSPGDFLNVGQEVCLPPYVQGCKYVVSIEHKGSTCQYYIVQLGDTLSSLSNAFHLEIKFLQEINSDVVDPNARLRPGQYLRLPSWNSDCPGPEAARPSCQLYSAKPGDTVSSISVLFRTTVESILEINPLLSAGSVLSASQPVKIPPFPASCGSGIKVIGPSVDGLALCRSYALKEGDNLASVSFDFGIFVGELASLNPEVQDLNNVQVGTVIKIPPWDDSCTSGIRVDGAGNKIDYKPSEEQIPSEIPVASSGSPIVDKKVTNPAPPPSALPSNSDEANSEPPSDAEPTDYFDIPKVDEVKDLKPPSEAPSASIEDSAPPPETSDVIDNKLKLELTVAGCTAEEFAEREDAVTKIIANTAGVPVANTSIVLAIASGSRKLLIEQVSLDLLYALDGDISSVSPKLQEASYNGSLSKNFKTENLSLKKISLIAANGTRQFVATAKDSVHSEKDAALSVPLGPIIGGAVGLFIAAVIVASLGIVMTRRHRKEDKENKRQTPPAGADAYITIQGKSQFGLLKEKNSHAFRPMRDQDNKSGNLAEHYDVQPFNYSSMATTAIRGGIDSGGNTRPHPKRFDHVHATNDPVVLKSILETRQDNHAEVEVDTTHRAFVLENGNQSHVPRVASGISSYEEVNRQIEPARLSTRDGNEFKLVSSRVDGENWIHCSNSFSHDADVNRMASGYQHEIEVPEDSYASFQTHGESFAKEEDSEISMEEWSNDWRQTSRRDSVGHAVFSSDHEVHIDPHSKRNPAYVSTKWSKYKSIRPFLEI